MDNEYRLHVPAALLFQSSVNGRFGGIWSPSLFCEGDTCVLPPPEIKPSFCDISLVTGNKKFGEGSA
jgi:hypothetical protein